MADEDRWAQMDAQLQADEEGECYWATEVTTADLRWLLDRAAHLFLSADRSVPAVGPGEGGFSIEPDADPLAGEGAGRPVGPHREPEQRER